MLLIVDVLCSDPSEWQYLGVLQLDAVEGDAFSSVETVSHARR